MKILSFLGTNTRRRKMLTMASSLLFLQATTVTATAKMRMMLAWQFRTATPEDAAFARKTMIQQAMNPLSITKERLLVAFDDEESTTKLAETAGMATPGGMLGFGQIRPLDDLYSELASLYVLPNKRGKGIGGSLVQELLSRHDTKGTGPPPTKNTEVVLLTLRPTTPLYKKYGFEILDVSEIPSSLQFEYKAGSIISAFLGNDLVCMKRTCQKQQVGS